MILFLYCATLAILVKCCLKCSTDDYSSEYSEIESTRNVELEYSENCSFTIDKKKYCCFYNFTIRHPAVHSVEIEIKYSEKNRYFISFEHGKGSYILRLPNKLCKRCIYFWHYSRSIVEITGKTPFDLTYTHFNSFFTHSFLTYRKNNKDYFLAVKTKQNEKFLLVNDVNCETIRYFLVSFKKLNEENIIDINTVKICPFEQMTVDLMYLVDSFRINSNSSYILIKEDGTFERKMRIGDSS